MTITLYQGRQSSASWRVRWALALKRVAYDSVIVDIASGAHADVLAPINPMRSVPTLVLDDGHVLTESVAIIEWLDETHPAPPLLPGDARRRARIRELVQLVNAGIHPLQNTIVRKAVAADAEGQAAWALRWITRGLDALEAQLAGETTRYAAGDVITMADLYVVPQVRNAERHGGDLARWPRLLSVYRACLDTDEARATDPATI